ncbi:uncharacterized protein LOC107983063 isoform X2 [Anolis carolinensis]|uniref:uncharacterized protein LOC134298198 n=1 Tax=Anolis carolinensis TaxID=28377 RepID=UPI002F2B805B
MNPDGGETMKEFLFLEEEQANPRGAEELREERNPSPALSEGGTDPSDPSWKPLTSTQLPAGRGVTMDLMQRQVNESWRATVEQREQRRGLPGRGTEPRPFAGEGPQDYVDEMPQQGTSVFPTGLSGRSQMPGKGEFRVKFNGDPKQLSYFITNVRHFMEDFGDQFPSESAKIHMVGANLKEAAADWLMQMYDTGARELACLEDFLRALRERFEDPLAEERAKAQLKRIYQGGRTVSEYALEFKATAGKIRDWSDTTKLEYFRAGLRSEVLEWALHRGNPRDLEDWILLAGRVEVDQQQISRRPRESNRIKPPTAATRRFSPRRGRSTSRERRAGRGACFACGREGHRAAECPKGTGVETKGERLHSQKPPHQSSKLAKGKAAMATETALAPGQLQAEEMEEAEDLELPGNDWDLF